MKHIRVIFPGSKIDFHTEQDLKIFNSDDMKVDIVNSKVGPKTISSRCEEALAIPGTIQQIVNAEKEGVDAVVIDCMGDPAVEQGRELVSIPVIGPSRTAMHVASTLGERFAVITMAEAVNPLVRQQARQYHLEHRLAVALSIGIPPENLRSNISITTQSISQRALEAVEVHGADTIILGCCGMMGCADNVKNYLKMKEYDVPVLDPLPIAIYYANMLLSLKLSHSKRLYVNQIFKTYPGFDFLK